MMIKHSFANINLQRDSIITRATQLTNKEKDELGITPEVHLVRAMDELGLLSRAIRFEEGPEAYKESACRVFNELCYLMTVAKEEEG